MKTEISSKITNGPDMIINNDPDPDLIPKEIFINWFFEVLKGTGSVQVEVSIKSVHVYCTKDSTGEPVNFEIDPENCECYIKETTLDLDIHPVMFVFDSITKKAEISF